LCGLGYILFTTILSYQGPYRTFHKVCNIIKNDNEAQKLLGPNIKCFGENSGRRRTNVQHGTYTHAQTKEKHHMSVFYAEGLYNAAEVFVDWKPNGTIYSLRMDVPLTGERLVFTKNKRFERRN